MVGRENIVDIIRVEENQRGVNCRDNLIEKRELEAFEVRWVWRRWFYNFSSNDLKFYLLFHSDISLVLLNFSRKVFCGYVSNYAVKDLLEMLVLKGLNSCYLTIKF